MNFLDVLFGNLITFCVFAVGGIVMVAIAIRAVKTIAMGQNDKKVRK